VTHTIDVLAESDEARMLSSQFSQGEVGSIRLCLQSHVTAVAIELPDESGVASESLGSG
jgi:hypothetical protein